MSRVTKRKHVLKEMMSDDFELPKSNQTIVRVIGSRGNNLHEVETSVPNDQTFLVSMPTKFRKNVWVKRGDFLLIESIEEGDKVKGEILKILSAEHIKEYSKCGIWPKVFTKKRDHDCVEYDDDDELTDDLVRNVNRPNFNQNNSEMPSSSSDEE